MAYIRNPADMQRKQTSAQSGVIGQGGATGEAQVQGQVSNWTNLNAYVDQNAGSGEQIAGEITKGADQAVAKFGDQGKAFAGEAQKSAQAGVKNDTGYGDLFAKGDLSNISDKQKQGYAAWKNAPNYVGPNSMTNVKGYGDVTNARDKAVNEVARRGTFEGQNVVARETFGKQAPAYSSGMSMLDTVLARQAGGADKLDALQKNNSAAVLNERLGGFKGQAAGAIAAAKTRGAENQAAVQNALQDRYKQSIVDIGGRGGIGGQSIGDLATDAELAALNNMIGMGANSMGENLRRSPTPPPPPPPEPVAAAAPVEPAAFDNNAEVDYSSPQEYEGGGGITTEKWKAGVRKAKKDLNFQDGSGEAKAKVKAFGKKLGL